jgi:L-ribulose-5-phosphate 3-epimerase
MKSSSFTPPSVSRREFVSMLALAGVAAPLSSSQGRAQSSAPSAPAAPAWAESSPFSIHVMSKPLHKMSYAAAAKLVAETGYQGIDYTVRVAQGHVLPKNVQEDLPRAIEAAHQAGLKAEMITTEITSARAPGVETLLRTAAQHGVKYYRLGYWDYDPKLGIVGTLEKLKPTLHELAALNASLGIHGAIQNHSGTRVGGPVWDVYELLRDIDPRWLGMQYDIRHACAEGGQSWSVGLKLLRPWIRGTVMKDFKWQQAPGAATIVNTPLGEGIVPLDAYFKLAAELKLGGPISMHFEYPPFERATQPLSAEEQRAQFAAGMKQDLAVLQGVMAKHRRA